MSPVLRQFLGTKFSPIQKLDLLKGRPAFERFFMALTKGANASFLGGEHIAPGVGAGHSFLASQSMNAAAAEILERVGATTTPFKTKFVKGSMAELSQTHSFLPLDDLARFREEQIQEFQKMNFRIPYRNLKETDQQTWIEATLQTAAGTKDILFPWTLISMHSQAESFLGPANSNGLALGTHFRMAYENGLAEVLERHAFLIHWWTRKSAPRYGCEQLKEILKGSSLSLLRAVDDRVCILDLSDVWNVPIYCALLVGRTQQMEPALIVSAACHPDPEFALQKSFTECCRIFIAQTNRLRNAGVPYIEPPYENSVRYFENVIDLYTHSKNRKMCQFLFEGPRPRALDLQRRMEELAQDRSPLEDRVLRKNARIVTVDLTPVDLALGGLKLLRIFVPEAIPLNSMHQFRPLGCPALRNIPSAELNQDPHPFS